MNLIHFGTGGLFSKSFRVASGKLVRLFYKLLAGSTPNRFLPIQMWGGSDRCVQPMSRGESGRRSPKEGK
jgi:hypothetical protein